jgi:hypothetical protein
MGMIFHIDDLPLNARALAIKLYIPLVTRGVNVAPRTSIMRVPFVAPSAYLVSGMYAPGAKLVSGI